MEMNDDASLPWEEAWIHDAFTRAVTFQGFPEGPVGYRLRRIILTNFWLYEHQVFEIAHGRLGLTGENASGKTTVMIAAMLALDSDSRPVRLDTLGGIEKHLEYYIVGGQDSRVKFERKQCTSYIALEFEWCDPEHPPFAPELRVAWEQGKREQAHFLTIGLVVSGRKEAENPAILRYRFAILDSSRLDRGNDTQLATTYIAKGQQYAHDPDSFREQLAAHGKIFRKSQEYEEFVSQALFGFSDVRHFQQLIELLMKIRNPKLQLTVPVLRDYLSQALPSIPEQIMQQTASTLERMNGLREDLESLQEAQNAAEKLYEQQERVAQLEGQLTANEYLYAYEQEVKADEEVQHQKQNLQEAIHDHRKIEKRIQEIQSELQLIHSTLEALEAKDEFQVVQQLAQVQEKVAETRQLLVTQLQQLQESTEARENAYENGRKEQKQFGEEKDICEGYIQEMCNLAIDRALWKEVAEQLEERMQQVKQFTLTSSPTFMPIVSLPSLLESHVHHRSTWLQQIKQSHEKETTLTIELQGAMKAVAQAQQQVQDVTDSCDELRQQLIQAEERVHDQVIALADQTKLFDKVDVIVLHERMQHIAQTALTPQMYIEQYYEVVNKYRATLKRLGAVLSTENKLVQTRLGKEREERGVAEGKVEEAQATYQDALSLDEFVPVRSEHCLLARQKLAEQGIVALPLYMLFDFTSSIDATGSEAGSIEYMLEDAGLLDALVILPEQCAHADMILVQEGLSDYRLIMEYLEHPLPKMAPVIQDESVNLSALLCFDASGHEIFQTQRIAWETQAQRILQILPFLLDVHTVAYESRQGTVGWTHSLITGYAGHGKAQTIGKATREREKRLEQEQCLQALQKLEEHLQQLNVVIDKDEQRREFLQETEKALTTVFSESGFVEAYSSLTTHIENLHTTQKALKIAQGQARQHSESISTLREERRERCQEDDRFFFEHESVTQALQATSILSTMHGTLQSYMKTFNAAWRRYYREQEQLGKAQTIENKNQLIVENTQQQLQQAEGKQQALEQRLQHHKTETVESILTEQKTLTERQTSLTKEEPTKRVGLGKALGKIDNLREAIDNAERVWQEKQRVSQQQQQKFMSLIASYPGRAFLSAQQKHTAQNDVAAALSIVEEPLPASLSEDAFKLYQQSIQRRKDDAVKTLQNALHDAPHHLHRYVPQLTSDNIVRFVKQQDASVGEFLNHLRDKIEEQELLLTKQEQELFEEFLLREMASAVKNAIDAANAWVKEINTILKKTAFIGEHYNIEWKELPSSDISGLSGGLAPYQQLLRQNVQLLKEEQVQTLVDAFKREVERLRELQQGEKKPLASLLTEMFDYRTWFRFKIYVTTPDQKWHELTPTYMKQGSGAEQYASLYVPLFVVLSAIYNQAQPGAPRLIALDEAFERVSTSNMQKLMTFLAEQQFQWIFAGTHLSYEGAQIPACVMYTMIRKEQPGYSSVATCVDNFWRSISEVNSTNDENDRQGVV